MWLPGELEVADTSLIHYTGPGVLVRTGLTYAPSLRPCTTYALLQVNDHLPMPNQCRSKLRPSTLNNKKCRTEYNLDEFEDRPIKRSRAVSSDTHDLWLVSVWRLLVPGWVPNNLADESRTTTFTRCQKARDVVPIPEGDHSDVMSLFYGQYHIWILLLVHGS